MKISSTIIKKIIREVHSFSEQLLGVHPKAVFADVHDSSITITLKDILPQVEKEHIGEQHIVELISRNYIESYNAVRKTFESTISGLTGQQINHSSFFIDAKANCGTILCTVSR